MHFLTETKTRAKSGPWQPHNTIIENELDTVIESGLGLKTVATDTGRSPSTDQTGSTVLPVGCFATSTKFMHFHVILYSKQSNIYCKSFNYKLASLLKYLEILLLLAL